MVVGSLGNKSPDSNRFTLVTPKPENGVRLQATLGNQNPTGLPVGVVRSKEVLNYRSNKEEVLSLKHSKGTNVSFVFNDAIGLKIKEEYYSKVSNMEFKVEDFKNDNIESIRYIDDLFVNNNKLVLKLKKDGQHYSDMLPPLIDMRPRCWTYF